jgi:hypothetical protein
LKDLAASVQLLGYAILSLTSTGITLEGMASLDKCLEKDIRVTGTAIT